MNRVIKFRAWNFKHEEMQPVRKIDFQLGELVAGNYRGLFDWDTQDNMFALMQFTGLLDKNGKEIWEGDIVRFTEEYIQAGLEKRTNEVVEYAGSSFNLLNANLEDWGSDVEVIGNIYENPELLKETK